MEFYSTPSWELAQPQPMAIDYSTTSFPPQADHCTPPIQSPQVDYSTPIQPPQVGSSMESEFLSSNEERTTGIREVRDRRPSHYIRSPFDAPIGLARRSRLSANAFKCYLTTDNFPE